MLRRRSIRTKMLAGLVLLTGVVCVLAFSGIWGLYRYRRLAGAISSSAGEIGAANGLHRDAVKLDAKFRWYSSFNRPISPLNSEGLADAVLFNVEQRRQAAWEEYSVTLTVLGSHLHSYEQRLQQTERDEQLLPERDIRLASLRQVRGAYNEVQRLDLHPFSASPDHALGQQLSRLVTLTKSHADAIQKSLATFGRDVKGEYRTAIVIAWSCLIVALAMVATLLWLFWALIVQPFRTLLEGSRMVAKNAAFNHRITLGTGDELDELASAMNAISSKFSMVYNHSEELRQNLEQEVQDRTREVIRNEQLASVGFLAAGVAHEINNPLTTIAWGAESLESQVGELREDDSLVIHRDTAELLRTTLKQIQGEAFRCKGITDRLLDFSRMSEVRRELIDLNALVTDVVGLVSKVGQYRCKTIRTHLTERTMAEVNSHQVRQVVLNLVTNALESVDSEGAVDISVYAENENAKIIVEDNGCGMSDHVKQHLFEPFFTRRQNGKGTGLGLSITCRIVSQHGGSLTPYSEGEGKGSRLEVTLPLRGEPLAAAA